jgi:hypothetical protein
MGMIHFFGRYVVLTIIVSFMKKDMDDATKRVLKQIKSEQQRNELDAKSRQARNKKSFN